MDTASTSPPRRRIEAGEVLDLRPQTRLRYLSTTTAIATARSSHTQSATAGLGWGKRRIISKNMRIDVSLSLGIGAARVAISNPSGESRAVRQYGGRVICVTPREVWGGGYPNPDAKHKDRGDSTCPPASPIQIRFRGSR